MIIAQKPWTNPLAVFAMCICLCLVCDHTGRALRLLLSALSYRLGNIGTETLVVLNVDG